MPDIDLYNMNGEVKGKVKLNDEVFAVPYNASVVHQALIRQLANRRSGTASTKTRAEVSGGGRKPWRQKGTGRSRHGSNRSPLWRKGGITFGPRPRDYSKDMPRKMRRLALKCALSVKVGENKMMALEELKMSAPRTREFVGVLGNLKINESVLFIMEGRDFPVEKSVSNLPGVKVITPDTINIHDIFNYDRLVMTKGAISRVEEVLV